MYWKTQKATYSRALTTAFLAALSARPGAILLTTPTVVLWTDGPPISPDWSPAAYTAPTFHGYVAAPITLSVPVNIGGTDLAVIGSVSFIATAGGTINDTVNGYAIVDTTLALPYMIESFANPISFSNPGDFLELDLILPLPMVYSPSVS